MISLFALFSLFVLAVFVGFEIISKIPRTLHTPLMSGTNAISGITIIGALLSIPHSDPTTANLLALFAMIMATINVIGGFMVTDRMLKMFGRREK